MYHILFNPASSGGKSIKKLEKLEIVLQQKGCRYMIYRSTPAKSLEDLSREITASQEDVNLIVVGGDGSYNAVVNGIKDFSKVCFGVVPAGTGNDLMRNFEVPAKFNHYLDYLLDGKVKHTIDVPKVIFQGDGTSTERRYLISCELGFGAHVCYRADKTRWKTFFNRIDAGSFIFLFEAVLSLAHAKPYNLRLVCDGKEEAFESCLSSMAMNGKYEGGGMKYCPQALTDDGLLDAAFGSRLSKLKFAASLPLAFTGKMAKVKGVHYRRATEIIMMADTPQYAHCDGEAVENISCLKTYITGDKMRLLF